MSLKGIRYLCLPSLSSPCTIASFLYIISPLETTVIRETKIHVLDYIILYGLNTNFTLCTMTLLNVLIQHIK